MKQFELSNEMMANAFEDKCCWHCERDKAVWSCWNEAVQEYTKEPEWEKACPILARALSHNVKDREYPTELRYCIDTSVCVAFINKDNPLNSVFVG